MDNTIETINADDIEIINVVEMINDSYGLCEVSFTMDNDAFIGTLLCNTLNPKLKQDKYIFDIQPA